MSGSMYDPPGGYEPRGNYQQGGNHPPGGEYQQGGGGDYQQGGSYQQPLPSRAPAPSSGEPPAVDTGRLWGGGLATAVVAGLVAWLGVLVAEGILNVELLAPRSRGLTGASGTALYVISAGTGALIATLILQILVSLTPRPLAYFSTIIGLITAAFAILPFTAEAPLSTQIATGLANLCVGLVILTMLPKVGYTAIRSAK
ncbi:DUF6069 family protein [Planobispora takensis]|uniref:Uncharacterized protein n=1 Tax=Planobispora takensis TaxID=1367882 RepID=A0A8J3ST51_9ACTN|nr:DUF6069 family protein [Planobispora takensis]GIH98382.1 hypothetical protein Pta02_03910 [Planobispora takensis]